MSFFIENWVLIAAAFVSGAFLVWPAVRSGQRAGTLAPNDAVMLMNREKAVVVDVSTEAEFAAGHIIGSRHVPVDEVAAKLAGTVKNKNLPVIFVCPTGARANRAVAEARKLGYEKAHSLSGGMGAWRAAGLPVEKA
mgnify:FL=1